MRSVLPLVLALGCLTGACESRGYVPPPGGAAPPARAAVWTVAVAAGPFGSSMPDGAEVGRHWISGTDSDDVFGVVASLASVPASTWKWRSNIDLDPVKVANASRQAMREARWDSADSPTGAKFALEGTVSALALDTWGPNGTATRARAKITVEWKLRDLATSSVVATGTSSAELRDHQPNVIETILPGALRAAQFKFMVDPAVRAAIRKPGATPVETPQPRTE